MNRVQKLESRGVNFRAEDMELVVDAPIDLLTPNELKALRAEKPYILAYLQWRKAFTEEWCPSDADQEMRDLCFQFAETAAEEEANIYTGRQDGIAGEAFELHGRCFTGWLELSRQ